MFIGEVIIGFIDEQICMSMDCVVYMVVDEYDVVREYFNSVQIYIIQRVIKLVRICKLVGFDLGVLEDDFVMQVVVNRVNKGGFEMDIDLDDEVCVKG